MKFKDVEIEWLHHDCFRITCKKIKIYTDPYKVLNRYNDADLILITHDHYDHLDKESIKKLICDKTIIIAPKDCEGLLSDFKNQKVLVSPDEIKIIKEITIKTVPSYNVNKFREKGAVFHPKEKGNVGYIFIIDNVRVYLAGDTDNIQEMKNFRTDIALLPVSGVYVMTPEEAAEAAIIINPEIVVPMHYGSGIGTEKEAQKFKRLLENKIRVEVLSPIDKS